MCVERMVTPRQRRWRIGRAFCQRASPSPFSLEDPADTADSHACWTDENADEAAVGWTERVREKRKFPSRRRTRRRPEVLPDGMRNYPNLGTANTEGVVGGAAVSNDPGRRRRRRARQGNDMKADKQKRPARSALALGVLGLLGLASGAADAAVRIDGRVQAGGGPVAGSTVTLWAGSAGEPKQLAQATTADDGSFALGTDAAPGPGESLYLIAKGGSVNKG